jgi:hypothetical protein
MNEEVQFQVALKRYFYATSRKDMGLIPDEVTGFFIDVNLPVALWPWGQLDSHRNEYQESSWG